MRKTMVLAALAAVVMVAAGASAQEARDNEPTVEQQEERSEAVRKIRVLENPYDISSFYRSRQTRGLFGDQEVQPTGNAYENPYAIAGYYRSRQQRSAYGYSPFWVGGYGKRGMHRGFGGRIGAHGDLFLIAPTILAPIGPLSGSLLVE